MCEHKGLKRHVCSCLSVRCKWVSEWVWKGGLKTMTLPSAKVMVKNTPGLAGWAYCKSCCCEMPQFNFKSKHRCVAAKKQLKHNNIFILEHNNLIIKMSKSFILKWTFAHQAYLATQNTRSSEKVQYRIRGYPDSVEPVEGSVRSRSRMKTWHSGGEQDLWGICQR